MPRYSVLKQDPTVPEVGADAVLIEEQANDGPSDRDIDVQSPNRAEKDPRTGDFIAEPSDKQFNSIQAYAVVKKILNMYRRCLSRMNSEHKLKWQWGDQPIKVYPRAQEGLNAYYSRSEKALKFFYKSRPGEEDFETVKSFDIVAHETGHAILDAIRSGYLESSHIQTGGLHEAFGDLTAIFGMLDQPDVVDHVIVKTRGNIRGNNLLSALAEEFGKELGRSYGLRNASHDYTLSGVERQVHSISRVFTGAVYDVMVSMYENMYDANQEKYTRQEILAWSAERVSGLLLSALLRGPQRNATFADIAHEMYQLESHEPFKAIIRHEFERREVDVMNPRFTHSGVSALESLVTESSFKDCCGTLNNPSHIAKAAATHQHALAALYAQTPTLFGRGTTPTAASTTTTTTTTTNLTAANDMGGAASAELNRGGLPPQNIVPTGASR